MLKKITVIGLGMMGASLCLAAKKRIPNIKITSIVRKEIYVQKAKEKKIVDDIFVGMNESAFDADIIIISVPVLSIDSVLKDIKPFLKKGTIVTDMGSVKGLIMEQAEKVFGTEQEVFIGSHPMCGSEKSGMDHAKEDLFISSTCIVTKTKSSPVKDVEKLVSFWKSLGCNIIEMDANEHDSQVAIISHLPHLLSTVLMNHTVELSSKHKQLLNIAGSGFSDMTRLSAGNPSIWMDIFEANRESVIRSLTDYKNSLNKILDLLKENKKEDVFLFLKNGAENKKDFENNK